MARARELLAAMSTEPASTADLYSRVGYATLARLGLIPYAAFRQELCSLAAAGFIESSEGRDGATLWRRINAPAPGDAP